MKKSVLLLTGVLFLLSCEKKSVVVKDTYAEVITAFENPPMEYRSMPLWVWNTRMTKEIIRDQLTDFKEKGIGGVFVHPRPGLITPYLSQEWFDMFKEAVVVGKELGMQVWIYDENSYPSGFAGGHVPDQMPEAKGKMIKQDVFEIIPDTSLDIICVLSYDGSSFKDITTNYLTEGKQKAKYYVYHLVSSEPSPWYAGFTYVDIMQKKVTEKFLEVTLDAYKNQIGEEFGKTITGSFQDEANIVTTWNSNIINYTPGLFEEFKRQWGYDLKPKLPLLYENIDDYKSVRYHYYKLTLDLFIDGWAIPYRDYCKRNNLQFTGHYWEHEWPSPNKGPDNMAMEEFNDMPGIDILFNQFGNKYSGQFGLDRSVKELRSVGNQLGKKRLMSETYGGAGWDITFADQKRIADWQFVLGINFVNQHLSHASLVGTRKNDYPQSFSYHEPWWENYKIMGDYLGRMSVFASFGEQINDILIIEPTTSGWMKYNTFTFSSWGKDIDTAEVVVMANQFHHFIRKIETAQIEYDLGSERIIQNHGKIDGNKFILGNRAYSLLVLPYFMECVDSTTFKLIKEYLKNGGKVLSYQIPSYIAGYPSNEIEKLAQQYPQQWINQSDTSNISLLVEHSANAIRFDLSGKGILFHHRRMLNDAQLLLLVNSSDSESVNGSFTMNGKSVEQWDAFTGLVSAYPFTNDDNSISSAYTIPPKGSLLLCIKETSESSMVVPDYTQKTIPAKEITSVHRKEANVLAIDYCDLKIKNVVEKDLYFYDAQTKAFQAHGWKENPWDHAVQFKSEIIDADTFKVGSGFEVSYHFVIEKGVLLKDIQAVIEQPKIFKVFVNGISIMPIEGKWWIDKDFAIYNIDKHLKTGKNSITLKVLPFTIYAEIEPIFILGNFSVNAAQKAFTIGPDKPMTLGSWKQQGMPFYSHQVEYSNSFKTENTTAAKYIVKLGKWDGPVADVYVNNKKAGIIFSPPYELDVTSFIEPDINKITVSVYGSLKNALGPYHNFKESGIMSPWHWRNAFKDGFPRGEDYCIFNYGLYEPFELKVFLQE